MRQAFIESPNPVEYAFTRVTPAGYNVKDPCLFVWQGILYLACTDVGKGGIAIFKEVSGRFEFFQRLFESWWDMWAPEVVEHDGRLVVFCNDTGGLGPYHLTQRIKYFYYDPARKTAGAVLPVNMGHEWGVIDPAIAKIGNQFYIFYATPHWTLTDKGQWEWWDLYISRSLSIFGPYSNPVNLSGVPEVGIEEAIFIWTIGLETWALWSQGPSDKGSVVRRGKIIEESGGKLNIRPDPNFIVAAAGSRTCTHPAVWHDILYATLRDSNGFYIGKLEVEI